MDPYQIGFWLLAGYTVGDLIGPVRRSVVEALESMGDAVDQDVDAGDGSGSP